MTLVNLDQTTDPTLPASSADNRIARRHRVLKSAKIVFDDWGSIDCSIRDVSDTGAKIRIDGALSLPHRFQLLIVSDNTIRPVEVAWTHNNTVGVTFAGPAERAPARKLTSSK